MTEWLLVLAGVALTIGTAVIVATEFSLVALDRPTVQKAIDNGDAGAEPVLASLRRLSTQLSAAQVGITLTTLILGFIATPSIGRLLETPLGAAGLSGSTLDSAAAILALVVAGRFLLGPLFRLIGRVADQELFVFAGLFVVVAVSALMHVLGLSIALGAFVAAGEGPALRGSLQPAPRTNARAKAATPTRTAAKPTSE